MPSPPLPGSRSCLPSWMPAGMRTTYLTVRRCLPRPVAVGARVLDHDAGAAAARAGLGEGEEALVLRAHAAAVALRAHRRAGARRRARAGAGRARRRRARRGIFSCTPVRASSNDRLTAVSRSGPRSGRDAGAAPPPRPPRARPKRSPSRSEMSKPRGLRVVAEAARVELLAAHAALGAELVVGLALLDVGEGAVGGGDLLEPLLGLLVARVGVGVVLARQLAVGLLDLVLGGVPRGRRAPRRGHASEPPAALMKAASSRGDTSTRPSPQLEQDGVPAVRDVRPVGADVAQAEAAQVAVQAARAEQPQVAAARTGGTRRAAACPRRGRRHGGARR